MQNHVPSIILFAVNIGAQYWGALSGFLADGEVFTNNMNRMRGVMHLMCHFGVKAEMLGCFENAFPSGCHGAASVQGCRERVDADNAFAAAPGGHHGVQVARFEGRVERSFGSFR